MSEQKRSPITGIKRVAVESSNIAEIGHDENTGVIEVKFRNGAVWQYPGGFDRATFQALVNAKKLPQFGSVGKFFRTEILKRVHTQKHIHVSQNEDDTAAQLGVDRRADR